ncbi:MAG TPA: TPM domain-containing protein [Candidatus Binatia bacterium]|nr:TPM domain-containing protein [Candidatus Binatia bacterium]
MGQPQYHSLALGVAIFFLSCSGVHSFDVPPLQGGVNDLAQMLSGDEAEKLAERLREFEEQTTHQIAVLTIPSLQGDALEDFSIRVADAWKLGQKGNDNGVILLIARDDRKIRIEVGYGLEGVLPDAIANRIIQDVIVPRFRDHDFSGGIESGVTAIIQTVRGERVAAAPQKPNASTNSLVSTVLLLLAGTALFGVVVGFAQPSPVRAATSGAVVSAIIGVPAIPAVGTGIWLIAVIVGAFASMLTIQLTRRAWGRSWNVRPSRHYDYSPRDKFRSGHGGTGSGGYGSTGSAGSGGSGGSGGGGGGFGGGGASGGW